MICKNVGHFTEIFKGGRTGGLRLRSRTCPPKTGRLVTRFARVTWIIAAHPNNPRAAETREVGLRTGLVYRLTESAIMLLVISYVRCPRSRGGLMDGGGAATGMNGRVYVSCVGKVEWMCSSHSSNMNFERFHSLHSTVASKKSWKY